MSQQRSAAIGLVIAPRNRQPAGPRKEHRQQRNRAREQAKAVVWEHRCPSMPRIGRCGSPGGRVRPAKRRRTGIGLALGGTKKTHRAAQSVREYTHPYFALALRPRALFSPNWRGLCGNLATIGIACFAGKKSPNYLNYAPLFVCLGSKPTEGWALFHSLFRGTQHDVTKLGYEVDPWLGGGFRRCPAGNRNGRSPSVWSWILWLMWKLGR